MTFKKWKTANKEKVSGVLKVLEKAKPKGMKEAFPIFKEQILYVCFRASQYREKDYELEIINNERLKDLKTRIPSQIKNADSILDFFKHYPEISNPKTRELIEGYKQKLIRTKNNKGWGLAGLILNEEKNKKGRDKNPEGKPEEISLRVHLAYHFRNFTAHQHFTNLSEACPTLPTECAYRIPIEGQEMPTYGDPCYAQIEEISDLFFPPTEEGRDDSAIRKQVDRYQRKKVLLTAWEFPFTV